MSQSTFTPTAASAAIAGFSFWALVWGIVNKLDVILRLFGIKNRRASARVNLWLNENKGLGLVVSEIVNFSIHGVTSSTAVLFALGGTLCNAIYIFVINPLICWRAKKSVGEPIIFTKSA